MVLHIKLSVHRIFLYIESEFWQFLFQKMAYAKLVFFGAKTINFDKNPMGSQNEVLVNVDIMAFIKVKCQED